MNRKPGWRFWFEAAISAASAAVLVVTLVWPSWIELTLQVEPDRGSGLLEWFVVLMSFALSLGGAILGWREWRRSPTPRGA